MQRRSWQLSAKDVFQNREVLFSFFHSYAIVLIIPFMLSLLFYNIAITETKEYAIQLNNRTLLSASESLELRLQEVDNIAQEIVHNASVRTFQNNTLGFQYPNTYKMIQVRDSLGDYSLTQDFVDYYFLFFNRSGIALNNRIIYTYEDFFTQYLQFQPEIHGQLRQQITDGSISTGLHGSQPMTILNQDRNNYLMLLQPLLDLGKGYLCILIDEENVTSLFDGIALGETGCIFVINSNGKIITSTAAENADLSAYDHAIAYSLENPSETHYTIKTKSGAMLVNQLHTDSNGLIYISFQPMELILAKVNGYRNIMLLAFMGAIILGFLLCFRQARHQSTPVTSLLEAVGLYAGDSAEALGIVRDTVLTLQADKDNLEKLASEHKTLLRSSFASRLLRGGFSSDAEASRVGQYVCPEYANYATACVLLWHLNIHMENDSQDVRLKLLGSMKVALKDVLDRVLNTPLLYDLDEETVAVITFDMNRTEIEYACDHLYDELPGYLSDSVSVFGGIHCEQPFPRIARSYEAARTTMMIQLLSTARSNQIIWAQSNENALQCFYPPDVRYRLTESITHGAQEDVKTILNELFHINLVERPLQPSIFRLFISELLTTAVGCLPMLSLSMSDEELNDQLSTIQNAHISRQLSLMQEFFHTLTACAEHLPEGNGRQMREVVDYISTHFRDNTLSLTSIAEDFSLNASALSTSFKQYTGKNLSAYLEDMRIQEAQRLLRTTDWTINRIAEEVGYLSANSFCRAFRRNTGQNTSSYKSTIQQERHT